MLSKSKFLKTTILAAFVGLAAAAAVTPASARDYDRDGGYSRDRDSGRGDHDRGGRDFDRDSGRGHGGWDRGDRYDGGGWGWRHHHHRHHGWY